MTDVEFLDPGPWQDPAPPPDAEAPPAGRSRGELVRTVGPAALWTAAAALALAAPFRLIYTLSLGTDTITQKTRVDGWGRITAQNLPFSEHDPRYGIVSGVAAGLFLVAAGLTLALAARRPLLGPRTGWEARGRRAAAALGLTSLGLLAGVTTVILLANASLRDNIQAEASIETDNAGVALAPSRFTTHFATGGMVWLSLAALGCGVVALLLQSLLPPGPRPVPSAPPAEPPAEPASGPLPGPPPGPLPVAAPLPHPLDEVLDVAPQFPPPGYPPIG